MNISTLLKRDADLCADRHLAAALLVIADCYHTIVESGQRSIDPPVSLIDYCDQFTVKYKFSKSSYPQSGPT